MTHRAVKFFLKLQIFKELSYQKSWHEFSFYLKLQILWDFIFNSKYLCKIIRAKQFRDPNRKKAVGSVYREQSEREYSRATVPLNT
jgi:hypothetical protein